VNLKNQRKQKSIQRNHQNQIHIHQNPIVTKLFYYKNIII
jgi:hypothetical protein